MGKVKDEVMKLSKAEQYEIYEAIESNLFGEKEGEELSKAQMDFINERLALIDSGKAKFINLEQLKKELDKLTG